MPSLLEAKNGNTRRPDWCGKLDSAISTQDGKTGGHTGGTTDKHHGRKDEENMKINNIVIVDVSLLT